MAGPSFTATLLAFTGTLIVSSLWLVPASRVAPLWVLVPTAALLLLRLALELRTVLHPPSPANGRTSPTHERRRLTSIVAWIAFLMVLVYLLGMFVAIALFLVPFLIREAGLRPRSAVLLAAVVLAVVGLAFGVLADIPFPEGRILDISILP